MCESQHHSAFYSQAVWINTGRHPIVTSATPSQCHPTGPCWQIAEPKCSLQGQSACVTKWHVEKSRTRSHGELEKKHMINFMCDRVPAAVPKHYTGCTCFVCTCTAPYGPEPLHSSAKPSTRIYILSAQVETTPSPHRCGIRSFRSHWGSGKDSDPMAEHNLPLRSLCACSASSLLAVQLLSTSTATESGSGKNQSGKGLVRSSLIAQRTSWLTCCQSVRMRYSSDSPNDDEPTYQRTNRKKTDSTTLTRVPKRTHAHELNGLGASDSRTNATFVCNLFWAMFALQRFRPVACVVVHSVVCCCGFFFVCVFLCSRVHRRSGALLARVLASSSTKYVHVCGSLAFYAPDHGWFQTHAQTHTHIHMSDKHTPVVGLVRAFCSLRKVLLACSLLVFVCIRASSATTTGRCSAAVLLVVVMVVTTMYPT